MALVHASSVGAASSSWSGSLFLAGFFLFNSFFLRWILDMLVGVLDGDFEATQRGL